MLRQGLFALVMMVLCFTFVAAETIKGKASKVDEKSITVAEEGKDAKAYNFAKGCKFCKMVKKQKEEIKDGVKDEAFAKIGKKGLTVTIETNKEGEVTEVIVGGKKKKTT